MPVGLLGRFSTLKTSMLNRINTRSFRCTNLNSDAFVSHCRTPASDWLRQGCRLSLNTVRCTVPSFNGIHTVLVSHSDARLVFAGALAGSAVEPHGIRYCAAGR